MKLNEKKAFFFREGPGMEISRKWPGMEISRKWEISRIFPGIQEKIDQANRNTKGSVSAVLVIVKL
jgi:hypothetical protein